MINQALERDTERGFEEASTFENIVNFRDLGGHRTAAGRARRGFLYRSATIHLATPTDGANLSRLGIRTVLDLRTDIERERWAGEGAWRALRTVHAPVLRSTWPADSAPEVGADSCDLECEAAQFLSARYVDMLRQGSAALIDCLETLADPRTYPALFHCAAGKDRTGVLAALVLAILGVSDGAIADDYHLSAPAMTALKEQYARAHPDETPMSAQPPVFLAAPRDAMLLFLAHLTREWGSPRGYALAHGADAMTIEWLHNLLVV